MTAKGHMEFLSWITRETLRIDPEARFVFGDNVKRAGMGGQAGQMRGEPNAIGVATKRYPGMRPDAFFYDTDVDARAIVDADIDKVAAAMVEGRIVYVPKEGIGTGLSELPKRAPNLFSHIVKRFRDLAGEDIPWSPL